MVATAEPDVWLKRLVGRYEVDGAIAPVDTGEVESDENQEGGEECSDGEICATPSLPRLTSIAGKIDCVAIGTGPGVQCVINIVWSEEWVGGKPVPVAYLDPSMMLFGLGPQHGEINMLLVDDHGLAEGGAGRIGGNTAVFMVPCTNARVENMPEATCERITRFEARPDARLVHAWIDIRDTRNHDFYGAQIVMTLRRIAEDKEVSSE
jgi:hypothetical protein